MTAAALVATLRARGVILEPRGDRLRVMPASAVTADEVEALRRLKPDVLAILTGGADSPAPCVATVTAHLLAMPLDVFARDGQPIEIRVRWWPETLWFVPDVRHAETLHREEIARHRIWTAGELIELLRAPGLTTEALLTIMRAREAFDGEVVEVRCR
jgi:hypothetical protein